MTTAATAAGATGSLDVSTGVRLAYRDLGQGEPVLLTLGVAGSLGLWGHPWKTPTFSRSLP